jgi:hypothetical protein
VRTSTAIRSCCSLLLVACGCGFHFDDFYAATGSPTSDASLPSTSDDGPSGRGSPAAGDEAASAPARADAGRVEGPAPSEVDGGAEGPPLDACAGAATASCGCDGGTCAVPADAPLDASTPLVTPVPGIRLRYDFSGQGTTLEDRVGTAHATLLGGAQLNGSGSLTLDGHEDYVQLPSTVLSSLDSVTIVAWITSTTSSCWQRVFDVATTSDTPGRLTTDVRLAGELFLTADECPAKRVAAIARSATSRQEAQSPAELVRDRAVQLAVVVDAARGTLTLYIDGARANETGSTLALRVLVGGTFWLGRSMWQDDPYAKLRFDEFRIYERALGASDLAELAKRGADVP